MKKARASDKEKQWVRHFDKVLRENYESHELQLTEQQKISLARFAIKEQYSFEEVYDLGSFMLLLTAHRGDVHRVKERQRVTLRSDRGSLERLLLYAELKKALSPLNRSPVSAWPQPLFETLQPGQVVEVKLTLKLEHGSPLLDFMNESGYLFAPSIKTWLSRLSQVLEEDEGMVEGQHLGANAQTFQTHAAYEMNKVAGDEQIGEEVLNGFPAVVETSDMYGRISLRMLEPELPPKKLASMWDNLYRRRKTAREGAGLRRRAIEDAKADAENMPLGEEYYSGVARFAVDHVRRNARAFDGLTDDEHLERLRELTPQFVDRYFMERFEEFREERLDSIDYDALAQDVETREGSRNRAKAMELQQEILGRVAIDVCMDGAWRGEYGFTQKVLQKYRQQADRYGVDPNFYGEHNTPDAIKLVNKSLDYLEKTISGKLVAHSPFRENPYTYAEHQRRKRQANERAAMKN